MISAVASFLNLPALRRIARLWRDSLAAEFGEAHLYRRMEDAVPDVRASLAP